MSSYEIVCSPRAMDLFGGQCHVCLFVLKEIPLLYSAHPAYGAGDPTTTHSSGLELTVFLGEKISFAWTSSVLDKMIEKIWRENARAISRNARGDDN